MLAAFFETFMWTFFIFVLAELALRMIGGKIEEQPSMQEQLAEKFEDAIVMCRVEKISDVFYFYNAQDENFVGQARSMSEMEEISDRLQKHIMVVDGKDEAVDALKEITNETSISK